MGECRSQRSAWAFFAALALSASLAAPAAASFVTFESGQVRPLALSPDGSRLFAVNTPDDSLEIFAVNGGDLTHLGSVRRTPTPTASPAPRSG